MAGKQMRFAEYEEKIIGAPSIVLRYIMKDAKEAIAAFPDGPNVQYYSDEILLCDQEISRRLKPKNRRERHDEFHATLTEMAVILKNAGYSDGNMIDDLKDLVNVRQPKKPKASTTTQNILSWSKLCCSGRRRLEITVAILTAIAL